MYYLRAFWREAGLFSLLIITACQLRFFYCLVTSRLHITLCPPSLQMCAHPQTARADPTTSRLQAELQAPALCRERLEVFCRRAAKEPARAPAAGGGSSRHTTCRATAPSDAPHPPSAAPASPREGGPGKHSTSTRRLHVTEEPTLSQEGTLQKHLTAKRLELLSSLRAAMR